MIDIKVENERNLFLEYIILTCAALAIGGAFWLLYMRFSFQEMMCNIVLGRVLVEFCIVKGILAFMASSFSKVLVVLAPLHSVPYIMATAKKRKKLRVEIIERQVIECTKALVASFCGDSFCGNALSEFLRTVCLAQTMKVHEKVLKQWISKGFKQTAHSLVAVQIVYTGWASLPNLYLAGEPCLTY